MAPTSQSNIATNQETGSTLAPSTTTVSGEFAPSVWGDFFITYTPPISQVWTQMSEEWMRERADQLKAKVRQMFDSGKALSLPDTLVLVDTLERLGIENHFCEEIEMALRRVQKEGHVFESCNDINIAALRFRLLRQHGFWISPGVFDKFKDDTASFSDTLLSDPRSMLSLYNAAHLAIPDEHQLHKLITTLRSHLESIKGKLGSPMVSQVSRALEIPLPRYPKRLETLHYIREYEEEDGHSDVLLELARLEFNFVRSLHLKELKNLSLWWKDLYNTVNLRYSRDRIVEIYFWTCTMLHEEEYSHARMLFAKTFGFFSLMDDTYDVHATLDECYKLNEAIQMWDESAVSILPEYLRTFYIKLLRTYKEYEDSLKSDEKYRVFYVIESTKLLSKTYLQEAKWSHDKYMPSSKEHLDASIVSSGVQPLSIVTLMGMGDVATKRVYDWAMGYPDVMKAGAAVTRFLNDIASYKVGRHKKDVASFLDCYMMEHAVTGDEAVTATLALVEDRWRRMNLACMEIDREMLPLVQLLVKIARTNEVMYLGGRDAYTIGKDLEDPVTSLFLKHVPI